MPMSMPSVMASCYTQYFEKNADQLEIESFHPGEQSVIILAGGL